MKPGITADSAKEQTIKTQPRLRELLTYLQAYEKSEKKYLSDCYPFPCVN